MKLVYNCLNIIQNALLPATCILCGNAGYNGLDMCEICHNRLPRNSNCCCRCAETFVSPITTPTLCGRCLKETPAFDATVAPFTHQDEIRYLINGLKFGSQFKNARLLGRLLAENIELSGGLPDCIIPVPLHASRYHERGFNQSLEIARTIAQILDVGINHKLCIRHKDTTHQTSLSAKERRKNLRRAFSVVNPLVANQVVILDDVMTTGTTANELAKVLKQSGASRVDVWVCARA